jgi:hypothetical protein
MYVYVNMRNWQKTCWKFNGRILQYHLQLSLPEAVLQFNDSYTSLRYRLLWVNIFTNYAHRSLGRISSAAIEAAISTET